jgi:hypothetical protein
MPNLIQKPRLSIDLDEAEYNRLRKCVPWGYQRRLFTVLLETVCDAVEEHGELALVAIMTGRINVLDIIPPIGQKEAEDGKA